MIDQNHGKTALEVYSDTRAAVHNNVANCASAPSQA
jgi:hypothetical protein